MSNTKLEPLHFQQKGDILEKLQDDYAKHLYHLLWSHSSESYFILNKSLQITSTNASGDKLLTNISDYDFQQLLSSLPTQEIFNQSASCVKDLEITLQHQHFCGDLFSIDPQKCLLILKDITNLKRAEKKLEEAEDIHQELDDIIDISADGIVIVDNRGTILRMNKAYQDIVGAQGEDFIGRHVSSLKEEGYLEDVVSLHVLKNLQAKTLYLEVNGKEVLLTGRPVFNHEGKLRRIIANIRDMSELNQLKEKLKEVNFLTDRYKRELKKLREAELEKNFIANSAAMREVLEMIIKASKVNSNVMLYGETGTGKEMAAQLVHHHSSRTEAPFLAVNCSALTPSLLEAELFGYEGGSFTGADPKGKIGILEAAHGGTLFLDEIGEMPLDMQVKLLRTLEEKKIRRIGGRKEIPIDVRWISATNQDLHHLINSGLFREDLFYRLNVIKITLPPLRERKEDIPLLVNHFLKVFNSYKKIPSETMNKMIDYHWPGNIRELRNAIERLVVLDQKLELETDEGWKEKQIINSLDNDAWEGKNLKDMMEQVEKKILLNAYQQYGSTRKVAAQLGISQATVVRKMQKWKD